MYQRSEADEREAKERNELSVAEYFYRRSTLRRGIEDLTKQYEGQKALLDEKLEAKVGELEALDSKASQIKESLSRVDAALVTHYSDLLKEGTDVRSEGLEWLVKALWNAKVQVNAGHFPRFLDAQAVAGILELARLSVEVVDVQRRLDQKLSKACSLSQSSGRMSNLKLRLKQIKSNLRTQRKLVKFDRKTRETHVTWEDMPLALSARPHVEGIEEAVLYFDGKMSALRQRADDLKAREIERLTHLCYMNNYEKKYEVELRTLLACIVGIQHIGRYLASIHKERTALSTQLMQTKTFKFSKKPKV
jgi:hypothetical protein